MRGTINTTTEVFIPWRNYRWVIEEVKKDKMTQEEALDILNLAIDEQIDEYIHRNRVENNYGYYPEYYFDEQLDNDYLLDICAFDYNGCTLKGFKKYLTQSL